MQPLLACFPMCLTFVAIGIICLIVVVFGLSNPVPVDNPPAADDAPSRYGGTGPPPWWVFVLMVVALIASVFFFAWLWPE